MNNELLKHRIVFFSGEFNMQTCQSLKEQIMYLNLQSHDPITLILESPGGEIDATKGVIDLVQLSPAPIKVVGNGMCASSCSYFLAVATTKGNRYMTKRSTFMIHQPLISSCNGNYTEINDICNRMNKTYDFLFEEYLKASNLDQDELKKLFMNTGSYLSAKEALQYGFVDHIIENIDEIL